MNAKPCPQCGGELKPKNKSISMFWICKDCEMELYDDFNQWWIWKELERLENEYEKLAMKYRVKLAEEVLK